MIKKDDEHGEHFEDSNDLIYSLSEYFDEACSKRTVTSLEWSPHYPELFLAGYSKSNDFNINQKNGLLLVWSLALRKEPEFTFTCQPEISSALFHAYNPKLIVGGTQTGQVLIWDTRGKEAPVYKTPLGLGGGQSGSGFKTHTSEITCLGIIGSTNSSHIISLSNGAICMWSLSNLSKPVKRIELKSQKFDDREKNGLHEIGVMSMGLQQYESNNLLIGSDDNEIYQISLHGDDSRSSVVNSFKGHEGPVYSIDYHPPDYYSTYNFSHLFATTSADWTTRLWSKTKPDGPLLTLENSENYVYCAKWCPTNASILACSDGDGYLDIWDLIKNKEQPSIHCKLGNEVLNKMSWTEDGKRMAIGDSSGKIQLLGMDKKIYKSTPEDSSKFEKIISKMKS